MRATRWAPLAYLAYVNLKQTPLTSIPTESFSPGDLRKRLDTGEGTIRCWIKTGRLRAYKLGNRWRISREAVEEFLARSAKETGK